MVDHSIHPLVLDLRLAGENGAKASVGEALTENVTVYSIDGGTTAGYFLGN